MRSITVGSLVYQVVAPDSCPLCHRHSELEIVRSDITNQNTAVQVVYRCAYQGCRSFFIGYYGRPPAPALVSVKPMNPLLTRFPEAVTTLSPTFVSVFAEAEAAAQLGLSQISGPDYRKAFEFLIKDYAKSLAPDKTAEIEKKFSGVVVSEYIPDARIQAVAKRCLWIGNDETHYLRRWANHDVTDLVTLIELTTNWIDI